MDIAYRVLRVPVQEIRPQPVERRQHIQRRRRALSPTVAPLDRQYYERRDRMAFDVAAESAPAARDALLRIVQRDPDEAERRPAEKALRELAAMTGQQESGTIHIASA